MLGMISYNPMYVWLITDEMVTDGDNDIEIDYNSISTIKPGVKLEVKSTSTVKPTQRYNNNIIPIDNGEAV